MVLRSLFWILLSFLFISCSGPLRGVFEVGDEDIQLVDKLGRSQTFEAGSSYNASVSFENDRTVMALSLKGVQPSVYRFKVPPGRIIPERSGSFVLESEKSEQPYDIEGQVDYQIYESETYVETEMCYIDPYCYEHDPYNSAYCPTRTGYQDVEYFNRTHTRIIEAQLFKPDRDSSVAALKGEWGYTERVYTFKGRCRRYY